MTFTLHLTDLTDKYETQKLKFVAYGYDILISSVREFFNTCPEIYCIKWFQNDEYLDIVLPETFYKGNNKYYFSQFLYSNALGYYSYEKNINPNNLSNEDEIIITEKRCFEIRNCMIELEKFLNSLSLDIYKDNFGNDSEVILFKDYIEVKAWKEELKKYVSDFITYL